MVLILQSGHFHADEALAVYLLRLLPSYSSSPLLRTRDPALLSTCHTVVDVGGEYDPATNRFDHHQRTFATTFPSHYTKLSSAGLVYMHFGRAIIAQRASLSESEPSVSIIHEKLYQDFVEAIDANDNGISAYDPSSTTNLTKRFKDNGISIASLVGDLNYPTDDPLVPQPPQQVLRADISDPNQAEEDARFEQASQLMGTTFLRKLAEAHTSWLPARGVVQKAYSTRHEIDPSSSIMIIPTTGVPWKDHLYTCEEEAADKGKVLFVLYPEKAAEDSKWRVQAVSVSRDSFENRRGLREEWRGVRDEDLSKKSGIEGCVFVHAAGFIGGNTTKEGALEMARQSLED